MRNHVRGLTSTHAVDDSDSSGLSLAPVSLLFASLRTSASSRAVSIARPSLAARARHFVHNGPGQSARDESRHAGLYHLPPNCHPQSACQDCGNARAVALSVTCATPEVSLRTYASCSH